MHNPHKHGHRKPRTRGHTVYNAARSAQLRAINAKSTNSAQPHRGTRRGQAQQDTRKLHPKDVKHNAPTRNTPHRNTTRATQQTQYIQK